MIEAKEYHEGRKWPVKVEQGGAQKRKGKNRSVQGRNNLKETGWSWVWKMD